MKIRFYYEWNHHEPVYGHAPYLCYRLEIINPEQISYSKFLLGGISDLSGNDINITLVNIEKLERGEIDEYCTGGDNDGLMHFLKKDVVDFEIYLFGICPHWPFWQCSFEQYKTALLGWKKFLEMPEDINTELIIDLPSSNIINRPFDYDASFDDQVDDLLDKVLKLEVGEISVFHLKGVNYEQTWTDSEVSFIYPLDPESRQWQVHPYTLAEHKAEILSWKQAILYAKTHEIDG
jgi:hypothetical protein